MYSSHLFFVPLFLCLLLPSPVSAVAEYVGSDKCSECHMEKYSNWQASGHHLQLRTAEKAQHANLALPDGYSWDDISYVVGGVNNKARFIDKGGFVITSAKDGSKAKTQYNLEDDSWSYYLSGEKKPFDCAFCHTTGYSPDGHQGGLEGVVGEWKEDGIGCEACHGPGSEHAKKPAKRITRGELSAKLCERCHQRGGIGQDPLIESGLVRHHDQINELQSGPHKGLSCLNCHNPHRRATQAKDNCTICHSRLYASFKTTTHGKADIKCYECHMPRVSKSAISRNSYIGEVRTHLFKINTDPKADMFKTIEEKNITSTFTKGFVTVDFACLNCHGSRDKAWALKYAKGFHE
jgi:hypothetical protein